MKNITITRLVEGPFTDYLVNYKGILVGVIDPVEHSAPYSAAEELAKEFLSDLKIGNVPRHYLNI